MVDPKSLKQYQAPNFKIVILNLEIFPSRLPNLIPTVELAPSWPHIYLQGPTTLTDRDALYYEFIQIPIQDK